MNYDFSFDKKSVFFIVGGCVAIGVLLFFAGFILGWDRGTYEARMEMRQQNPSVVASNLPLKASQQPESQSAGASVPDPQALKPSTAPADSNLGKPASSVDPNSGDKNSEGKSGQPSEPAPSSSRQKSASPDATGFSLQVGAFQNENNALHCQTSFKSRGYPVFVFNTVDAGGRAWHAVRIGRYPDIQKALEAAATFTGKEKIPVFVRPLNEL